LTKRKEFDIMNAYEINHNKNLRRLNMKKIVALMLLAVMAFSLVACTTASVTTPTATQTPDGTTTSAPTTSEKPKNEVVYDLPIKSGTYTFTHVSSNYTIKSDKKGMFSQEAEGTTSEVSVDWVVDSNTTYYRLGLFGIEQKTHKDKDGVVFNNYEVLRNISIKKISADAPIEAAIDSLTDKYQLWKIVKNDDGTFYVCPRVKVSDRYLTVKDGQLVLATVPVGSDASACKWKIENVSTTNSLYKEYVSDNGKILVRVPLDVFEKSNYGYYRNDKTFMSKQFVPTEEVLVQYANNVELAYETYIDLTNFIPYYNIIIHAYNYQGVMAGVVGNNNNVFVNCGPGEWFYSDLSKMQYRWEADGKKDFNFMALHEIGHMFDFGRGWTFESEMQADMKAAYVLCNIEGAYAAPAEYEHNQYFGKDIAEGYKGLSGGKMKLNMNDTGYGYGYSIYRFAEILTRICADETGWEALRQTFHWFQSKEGMAESRNYTS
jgi:hypothetical protein